MGLYKIKGKIFPKPPYDFLKTIDFVSNFFPAESEQIIYDTSITKAIYLNEQILAFKLTDEGTIEKPVLSYTLFSYNDIDDEIKSELLKRITFYMSLDDDLKPFYAVGREDPQFKPILESLYGLHQVKFLTPFEAAAWAVLSQRISMKVARLMKNRIIIAAGDHIKVEGIDYRTFPDAAQLKKLGVEKLQVIIKNKRKSDYLMSVANAFDQVDERFLQEGDIEEVKEWLMDIKGIGEWSAHLELIRGLGRMEEIPEHDKMLLTCFNKIYGTDITENQLKEIADRYGKYKGYWTYYLRAAC